MGGAMAITAVSIYFLKHVNISHFEIDKAEELIIKAELLP